MTDISKQLKRNFITSSSLLTITNFILKIYVDGPYGAPSVHIFEAEHAVLIAGGIGVTPFASILQSIMKKVQSATNDCPLCHHKWIGGMPQGLQKLRKVS